MANFWAIDCSWRLENYASWKKWIMIYLLVQVFLSGRELHIFEPHSNALLRRIANHFRSFLQLWALCTQFRLNSVDQYQVVSICVIVLHWVCNTVVKLFTRTSRTSILSQPHNPPPVAMHIVCFYCCRCWRCLRRGEAQSHGLWTTHSQAECNSEQCGAMRCSPMCSAKCNANVTWYTVMEPIHCNMRCST